MDFSQITLFSLMHQKMQYLGERQGLLAQNIANADTPGYVPRDLKPLDFSQALAQTGGTLSLARTSPKHLEGGQGKTERYKPITRSETAETNPNGNKVSIEEEVQRMSMNQSEYARVTLLYRKSVQMFNTVIGRNGGA